MKSGYHLESVQKFKRHLAGITTEYVSQLLAMFRRSWSTHFSGKSKQNHVIQMATNCGKLKAHCYSFHLTSKRWHIRSQQSSTRVFCNEWDLFFYKRLSFPYEMPLCIQKKKEKKKRPQTILTDTYNYRRANRFD